MDVYRGEVILGNLWESLRVALWYVYPIFIVYLSYIYPMFVVWSSLGMFFVGYCLIQKKVVSLHFISNQ